MLTKDRIIRKKRIRGKISGTAARPRLTVFRSNKAIYAQIIDDVKGVTIVEAHGTESQQVGADIAQKAVKAKVTTVVFDRNGYIYHGRVKALADAARAGGLTF